MSDDIDDFAKTVIAGGIKKIHGLEDKPKLTRDKAQHTPGPWETDGNSIRNPKTAVMLATIYSPSATDFENHQRTANAKLIAAAPDMAEALKKLIEAWDEPKEPNETQYEIGVKLARAALAKAGIK